MRCLRTRSKPIDVQASVSVNPYTTGFLKAHLAENTLEYIPIAFYIEIARRVGPACQHLDRHAADHERRGAPRLAEDSIQPNQKGHASGMPFRGVENAGEIRVRQGLLHRASSAPRAVMAS